MLYQSKVSADLSSEFYLCGRNVVDLKSKIADGGLAENHCFLAAFHLNQVETRRRLVKSALYRM